MSGGGRKTPEALQRRAKPEAESNRPQSGARPASSRDEKDRPRADNRRRILLVGRASPTLEAVSTHLDLYGKLEIGWAGDGESARKSALSDRPDILLLFADFPQAVSETCMFLREAEIVAPILVYAELANEAEAVLALDCGANDYIGGPMKLAVLLARVRAHLRASERQTFAVARFGPFKLDLAARSLFDSEDRIIPLTEKEAAILKYLHRAGGKVVPRNELLQSVWGYNVRRVTTHTLETHIYRLRRKLERDLGPLGLLRTDAGGYRLEA